MNSLFAPVVRVVEIDVKPGSETNSVNPGSHGVLPVAILTTSALVDGSTDFDAGTVDRDSVRLGPQAAPPAHSAGHLEDADGDGDIDLVLHFRVPETGIACGDTSVGLVGTLAFGGSFEGNDSIRAVGCSSGEP